MTKLGIEQDAHFSQATAQQGDALRKSVHAATVKGLLARALTLSNTKQVLNAVARAAAFGTAGQADFEASSPAALKFIFVGVRISVPAIAAYTVFSYRVFNGKTRALRYA